MSITGVADQATSERPVVYGPVDGEVLISGRSTLTDAPTGQRPLPNGVALVTHGIVDLGINPYHVDFLGENVPNATLKHLATYRPIRDAACGGVELRDEDGRMLPFTRHPSCYISGYPADAAPIALTLGDYNADADADVWDQPNDVDRWYWVPGTKIVGLKNYGETLRAAHLDETTYGHGAKSASVAAGAFHGACRECLLVSAGSTYASRIHDLLATPWVDVVSRSAGWHTNAPPEDLSILQDHHLITRTAAERGKTFANSAGNGMANAFVATNQTFLTAQRGPDWSIVVGATQKFGPGDDAPSAGVQGSGKPPDWVSYGAGPIRAACSLSYDDHCSYGGTSAAAPIATGHMAAMLLEARKLLSDRSIGVRPPDDVGGVLQAVASGQAILDSPWLADGVLTRAELWFVAFNCADVLSRRVGAWAVGIESPVDPLYAGYGVANLNMQRCAVDALRGVAQPSVDPLADEWDAQVEAARDAIWGDWDGDGDGAPGGSHRDMATKLDGDSGADPVVAEPAPAVIEFQAVPAGAMPTEDGWTPAVGVSSWQVAWSAPTVPARHDVYVRAREDGTVVGTDMITVDVAEACRGCVELTQEFTFADAFSITNSDLDGQLGARELWFTHFYELDLGDQLPIEDLTALDVTLAWQGGAGVTNLNLYVAGPRGEGSGLEGASFSGTGEQVSFTTVSRGEWTVEVSPFLVGGVPQQGLTDTPYQVIAKLRYAGPDGDGDGVGDAFDACPDAAGSPHDGCTSESSGLT